MTIGPISNFLTLTISQSSTNAILLSPQDLLTPINKTLFLIVFFEAVDSSPDKFLGLCRNDPLFGVVPSCVLERLCAYPNNDCLSITS